MQLAEYYLRLRSAMEHVPDGEDAAITMAQLMDIFICSSRNCQIVLQKLIREGWITWTPGRGRGNQSRLSFRVSREEILMQAAQELVEKGELKQAVDYIETYAGNSWEKARFHDWLGKQFGYQPVFTNNQRLDTLRLFFPYPFFSLDPAKIQYSFQKHIVSQLFDGLVRYNSEKKRLDASLAHYWDVSHEGDFWRFYLRKGILFHHGKEMNARDAAYTLLRLKSLSATVPELWIYGQIETVNCTEEYSFEIQLTSPNHGFIHYLASERASIIPEGICEEMNERFALQPLGTGPFRVNRNDCHLLILHAHPYYFQGRAHLDQIELWVIEDKGLIENALTSKTYDLHLGTKSEEESSWKSVTRQATGCKLLLFNMKKSGWMQDPRFRQALCSAIWQPAFLDIIGSGDVSPATGLLAGEGTLPETEQHPDSAALLREAGYNGEGIRFFTYTFQQNEQEARWLIEQWEKLGVNVELTVMSPHEFGSTEYVEMADLVMYYQAADENPELFLQEMYLSPRSRLYRYLSLEIHDEVGRHVHRITKEPSATKRIESILALEHKLKLAHALYFLYHRHESASYHPALNGVTLNALGWVPFKEVWFQSRKDNQ